MKLDGPLSANLQAAVNSARRFRGRPVYPDTLRFWNELLVAAWGSLSGPLDADHASVRRLAGELEAELAARRAG